MEFPDGEVEMKAGHEPKPRQLRLKVSPRLAHWLVAAGARPVPAASTADEKDSRNRQAEVGIRPRVVIAATFFVVGALIAIPFLNKPKDQRAQPQAYTAIQQSVTITSGTSVDLDDLPSGKGPSRLAFGPSTMALSSVGQPPIEFSSSRGSGVPDQRQCQKAISSSPASTITVSAGEIVCIRTGLGSTALAVVSGISGTEIRLEVTLWRPSK